MNRIESIKEIFEFFPKESSLPVIQKHQNKSGERPLFGIDEKCKKSISCKQSKRTPVIQQVKNRDQCNAIIAVICMQEICECVSCGIAGKT